VRPCAAPVTACRGAPIVASAWKSWQLGLHALQLEPLAALEFLPKSQHKPIDEGFVTLAAARSTPHPGTWKKPFRPFARRLD
jgi:hypothetical protein